MWPFKAKGEGSRYAPAVLGRKGEKLASKHLRRRGMKILGTNYNCPAGEADIIAFDRRSETIAFVEVKTRSSDDVVSPVSAVDTEKRSRLKRIANHYIATHNTDGIEIRFDVISIVMPSGEKPRIDHIIDAF